MRSVLMKRDALRRRILSKYNTLGEWCNEIGATRSGLSRIMTGKSHLPYTDVVIYCEKLGIQRHEIGDLFYPEVKE